MQPIIAAGIVSLGKHLIDRVIPNPASGPTDSANFESSLKGAEGPSRVDVSRELRQAREALEADPMASRFLRSCPEGKANLEQLPDGRPALVSDDGRVWIPPVDSEAAMLAHQIADLTRQAGSDLTLGDTGEHLCTLERVPA